MKKFFNHELPNAGLLLAFFAFISTSPWVSAQGNLLVNGGFDTSANGWTISNAPGGFGFQSVQGDPGGCVLLDNVNPVSTAPPTASQTILGLIAGETYMISGNYEFGKNRNSSTPVNASFGVAINGTFLFEAMTPADRSWQSFNFLYSAPASSAVLSLSSQINGTGMTYLIDNISVAAVPEPSVFQLLNLGGILLFFSLGKKITNAVANP